MTCGLGILALILLAGCDASVADCTTDSDCEGICESGRCEPAECGLAGGGAMCAAGELCEEGRCHAPQDGGVECTDDFECGDGICESGRCVPGECGFVGGGAMCAAGEQCMEGRCYVPVDGG